ncbi:MAG TPA: hypothetical protein VG917_03705 [Patescibacteria group bacterium]|nr:hypothetical protein [Patescibacteria group bacterium]
MKKLFVGLFLCLLFAIVATPALAHSGCCSHHGGVRADGCGCNDGSPLSSTCAPYYSCTAAAPQVVVSTNTPYPTRISYPTKKPTLTPTATPEPTETPTPTSTPTPTKKVEKHEIKKTSVQAKPKFNLLHWLFGW